MGGIIHLKISLNETVQEIFESWLNVPPVLAKVGDTVEIKDDYLVKKLGLKKDVILSALFQNGQATEVYTNFLTIICEYFGYNRFEAHQNREEDSISQVLP